MAIFPQHQSVLLASRAMLSAPFLLSAIMLLHHAAGHTLTMSKLHPQPGQKTAAGDQDLVTRVRFQQVVPYLYKKQIFL